MTLVYERTGQTGPVTHAIIIGCGRFAHLSAEHARRATPAGARKMVELLVTQADRLAAPLAAIDCLISDPTRRPGEDWLNRTGAHDPRGDGVVTVDNATRGNVEEAFGRWRKRRRRDDHIVVYMASHGVVEDLEAVGLLEDVNSNEDTPWAQALNITALAQGLPSRSGVSWVFLDACQEIISAIQEQIFNAQTYVPITPTASELTSSKSRPCFALAGARYGLKGWAPTGDEPPFFTQALLIGLSEACVEPVNDAAWSVTSGALHYSLAAVAEAALNYHALEPEVLKSPARSIIFATPADPRVQVAIRTELDAHLGQADDVILSSPGDPDVHRGREQTLVWTHRVPLAPRKSYFVDATFPLGGPVYQRAEFFADQAARIVVLKR